MFSNKSMVKPLLIDMFQKCDLNAIINSNSQSYKLNREQNKELSRLTIFNKIIFHVYFLNLYLYKSKKNPLYSEVFYKF